MPALAHELALIGAAEDPERPAPPARHFADNDVLTGAEMRMALKVSARHWSRVAPLLPCTYVLGGKIPRYIYGDVVAYLRKHSIRPPV